MPKRNSETAEIIPLEDVFKVASHGKMLKGKSMFYIMTSNGNFTLGTDSIEKTESWINTLNKELFGPPIHDVVCKLISIIVICII